MKALHLLAVSAALAGLLVLPAAEAVAQQRGVVGQRSLPPSHGGHFGGDFRGRHFHGVPFFVYERRAPVVVEREVVREVPAAPPPEPPPPPREPYVIGNTYASLPGGCMKLIGNLKSYYYCDGGWYQQLGGQYRAVREP